MCGIEVQWRDGNGAGKNRRVIRVGLHVLVEFLLVQPKITAPARICSFAELIARDLLRLPREFHAAVPRLRHIHVEQDLIRQSFFQNQFRGGPRHPRGIDFERRIAGSSLDRKSTRLNSSHVSMSYAVFCLKKKKKLTYLDT